MPVTRTIRSEIKCELPPPAKAESSVVGVGEMVELLKVVGVGEMVGVGFKVDFKVGADDEVGDVVGDFEIVGENVGEGVGHSGSENTPQFSTTQPLSENARSSSTLDARHQLRSWLNPVAPFVKSIKFVTCVQESPHFL
jgi:hypothetical protein